MLKGSLAVGTAAGTSFSFNTDTAGFLTCTGLVSGGGNGWVELKIDGVLFGLGGVNVGDNITDNRTFDAFPWVNFTVPIGAGKTCTITKRNHKNLKVDILWTPLSS